MLFLYRGFRAMNWSVVLLALQVLGVAYGAVMAHETGVHSTTWAWVFWMLVSAICAFGVAARVIKP